MGTEHTMKHGAPATTGARADTGDVIVRIPGPLRPLTDGRGEVLVPAGTVAEALETLAIRHPGLRRHLLTDEGAVRDYVNIFLGDDDVRYLDGVATAAPAGSILTIVPSIAGG